MSVRLQTVFGRAVRAAGPGAMLLAASCVELAACSTPFDSCAESKTCSGPADAGNAGRGGASGMAGSSGAVGTSGSAGSSAASGTSGVSGAIGADATANGGAAGGTSRDGSTPEASVPVCTAIQLATDPDHCGICDHVCSSTGTKSRTCDHGACSPVCDDNHRDCNGAAAPGNGGSSDGGVPDGSSDGSGSDASFVAPNDGCEIDVTNDAEHCGACDTPCDATGTTSNVCASGQCTPACDANHVDADGDGHNGCEIDLRNDPDNCGTLEYKCSNVGASERKCVAGKCAPVCTANFVDCANSAPAPDDGCETDATTPTNCGACGHGCLGGSCVARACKEFPIATGLPQPTSITADGSYLHWIDGLSATGRVMRSTLVGSGATPIATNQGVPIDVLSDGTRVFWTNGVLSAPAVRSVYIGQPSITDIATGTQYSSVVSPGPLAQDATTIYWGDSFNFKVFKAPKSGGAAPVALTGSQGTTIFDLEVAGGFAFFTTAGVGFVPLDQSAGAKPLGGNSDSVAVDNAFVYFTGTSAGKPSILKAPLGTTTVTSVAELAVNNKALAVDDRYLYYWTAAGLYRVNKTTGASPQLLSTTVDHVAKILPHKEGGGEAVYWVNEGDSSGTTGTIMKLAL